MGWYVMGLGFLIGIVPAFAGVWNGATLAGVALVGVGVALLLWRAER